MARSKSEKIIEQPPQINAQAYKEDAAALATLEQIESSYGEERDLINQLLGQVQMAGATEDFFRTVRTFKLEHIKKNKLYRALKGKKIPHCAEKMKGTWEEFCSLLGRSVDQVDRDIANLKAFGEEAMENLSRMDISYRKLAQYRMLPDDERQALIEAAKTGDKETVLEVAENITAQLSKQLADTKADYEVQAKLTAEKSEQIDQLKVDNERLRHHIERMPVDQKIKETASELTILGLQVANTIRADIRTGLEKLHELGHDINTVGALLVDELRTAIAELVEQFGLPEEIDEDAAIDWLKGVEEEVEEREAQS